MKSYVKIGNDVIIKSHVTVREGNESNMTIVRDRCYIMPYSYISRCCIIEKNVLVGKYSYLLNHVTVGQDSTIGNKNIIQSFCGIGHKVYLKNFSNIFKDIPPFTILLKNKRHFFILNYFENGLKKQKYNNLAIFKKSYKTIYYNYFKSMSFISFQIKKSCKKNRYSHKILKFLNKSKKGIIKYY